MATPEHTPTPENEQEEWRPVVGWEGFYEVSNLGRVRRVGKVRGARVGHVLACSSVTRGYHSVSLYGRGGYRTHKVHHLVASAFIGPMPEGMEVNHIDTNRGNNQLDNLEYVTPKGNSEHMVAMGHSARGERQANAKLTEAKVRAIRALRGEGMLLDAIAARFGVSRRAVRHVVRRERWAHVD